mmetsp:Transcript_9338/g.18202  ORF Transcript_9338/g.18202 Transcript_9338/m.18202 type:complete len:162 (-) Transcript_9338:342-827(-)
MKGGHCGQTRHAESEESNSIVSDLVVPQMKRREMFAFLKLWGDCPYSFHSHYVAAEVQSPKPSATGEGLSQILRAIVPNLVATEIQNSDLSAVWQDACDVAHTNDSHPVQAQKQLLQVGKTRKTYGQSCSSIWSNTVVAHVKPNHTMPSVCCSIDQWLNWA